MTDDLVTWLREELSCERDCHKRQRERAERAEDERDALRTSDDMFYIRQRNEARDERDELKRQLAVSQTGHAAAVTELIKLAAERDALRLQNDTYANLADGLRQDAMRYRWLRDGNNDTEGLFPSLSGDALDAEIDVALKGSHDC
jgi:chromosome segregation ATPase